MAAGTSSMGSLASTGPLADALLEHARRGARLQSLLRVVLVVFVVLTVSLVPPVGDVGVYYVVLAAYLAWTVVFAVWIEHGDPAPVRLAWSALLADVAVLAVLTLMAGIGAQASWTSYVLSNGFFLIPVLAATDLRPRVCAAAVIPTVVVSLASSLATQEANAEPLSSILLHHVVLAGLGAGCVALSQIQRSRVQTIGRLLSDRTAMLDELMRLDDRERLSLSENPTTAHSRRLAAQDLDEPRGRRPRRRPHRPALTESSRLLRSTVTELHPAVLEHAGLARAVEDLARTSGTRGGFNSGLTDLYGLRNPILAARILRSRRERSRTCETRRCDGAPGFPSAERTWSPPLLQGTASPSGRLLRRHRPAPPTVSRPAAARSPGMPCTS